MSTKAKLLIGALSAISLLGVAYDIWVIARGDLNNLSLYAPGCGVFAALVWYLERLSPEDRKVAEHVARMGSAMNEEAVTRRIKSLDRQGNFPVG